MGKNKLKKFDEMESFGNVLQYPYKVLIEQGFELKGEWNVRFFKNRNPIVVELGCGKGEYTLALAGKFKDINFVGIDIKGARMWSGAKKALKDNLTNTAFLRTYIELLEYFFAPGEVSEIWLTFPDPQMDKTNKRLTSSRFLEIYGKILKDNGTVNLKTDSNFMFKYTRDIAGINGFTVITETDNLYGRETIDDILAVKTFYEQQWLARGLTVKFINFTFCKNETGVYKEPGSEPEKDGYRSFGRDHRDGSSK
ncbi:MAG: tRNA (guanosine(46)-N7)-methyltransferase TrmB [Dysgonamonadaceae bacterium]|jgi:tRNA (guanine-N7-)-methyltransferase|nr:tRNA (guanosine(46)-N7)-methyltransferase TrmB [Dysgonamonadaceae bacterium]